jgi:hypothetical protein
VVVVVGGGGSVVVVVLLVVGLCLQVLIFNFLLRSKPVF